MLNAEERTFEGLLWSGLDIDLCQGMQQLFSMIRGRNRRSILSVSCVRDSKTSELIPITLLFKTRGGLDDP